MRPLYAGSEGLEVLKHFRNLVPTQNCLGYQTLPLAPVLDLPGRTAVTYPQGQSVCGPSRRPGWSFDLVLGSLGKFEFEHSRL